jgi:hypothetical protein
MTVTLVTRYHVADAEVGIQEVKRAKVMWMAAGAKDFRSHQFFTGMFQGQWLFHVDFEDFAHLQKCRDIVQKSNDMATILANNAKAGNKLEGREVLVGLDA